MKNYVQNPTPLDTSRRILHRSQGPGDLTNPVKPTATLRVGTPVDRATTAIIREGLLPHIPKVKISMKILRKECVERREKSTSLYGESRVAGRLIKSDGITLPVAILPEPTAGPRVIRDPRKGVHRPISHEQRGPPHLPLLRMDRRIAAHV